MDTAKALAVSIRAINKLSFTAITITTFNLRAQIAQTIHKTAEAVFAIAY